MTQDKLIKYITGNLSEEEAGSVRTWIGENQENKDEFIRLKNAYAFSGRTMKGLSVDSDYLQIKNRIREKQSGKVYSLLRTSLKYAAIVVFALLVGYSVSELRFSPEASINYEAKLNELIVPNGQISEFILNDGTHVWLNSGTKLRFPTDFGKKHRHIFLEGEGYFKVAKDKNRPFFVNSGKMVTKVLGTEFNVSAYKDNKTIETTLIEGSVEIQNSDHRKIALLKPEQQFVFSNNRKKYAIVEVDTKPYEAWKNGELYFRNKTLLEIKPKLERWYNVEIVFADEKSKTYAFSGTVLKQKPFDQILQTFQLTIPIDYKIKVKAGERNRITIYSIEN